MSDGAGPKSFVWNYVGWGGGNYLRGKKQFWLESQETQTQGWVFLGKSSPSVGFSLPIK